MSASITRELMINAGGIAAFRQPFVFGRIIKDSNGDIPGRPRHRHYYGLRNSLNFYGTRSPHYFVEYSASVTGQWNKDEQDINLVSVP